MTFFAYLDPPQYPTPSEKEKATNEKMQKYIISKQKKSQFADNGFKTNYV